jgi:hypothetical protein
MRFSFVAFQQSLRRSKYETVCNANRIFGLTGTDATLWRPNNDTNRSTQLADRFKLKAIRVRNLQVADDNTRPMLTNLVLGIKCQTTCALAEFQRL